MSFTRARRALIVIGNDATLRRGDPDTWMPWLAWADAHGLNMDKPGIPRGRYDPEQLRRVRGGTTAAEMLRDVLKRQQAQLKNAEAQMGKADKITGFGVSVGDDKFNSGMGNNSGGGGLVGGVGVGGSGGKALSLEEDLARLGNADGNWDDSDDEDQRDLKHSTSQPTLTSGASSSGLGLDTSGDDSSGPQDAWDL